MKALKELPKEHPMRDETELGKSLIRVATVAHDKHYDVTRRFADLNPDVQKYWLEITGAVVSALEDMVR